MRFLYIFQIFRRSRPPFGLHFGIIFHTFCIAFSGIDFVCILYWLFMYFRCPEPVKSCSRPSGGLISYISSFLKKLKKSWIWASILASFWEPFGINFQYFFGIDFCMPFWMPFFRFLVETDRQSGPKNRYWTPPLAPKGRFKNASATPPRFFMVLTSILGANLMIFWRFWVRKLWFWHAFYNNFCCNPSVSIQNTIRKKSWLRAFSFLRPGAGILP